jgi:hypothetical protein
MEKFNMKDLIVEDARSDAVPPDSNDSGEMRKSGGLSSKMKNFLPTFSEKKDN